MDVLATSRNTLWTSFFIVYLWVNGLCIFLLKEPEGFIFSLTITAALDCWRHSTFFNKELQAILSRYLFLITPIDHSWHHSSEINSNYGANLNIFDKIHGTYKYHEDYPERLGIRDHLTLFQKLFNPFRYNR
jgi:sterol desaturase/sphingolipid hydroxylase (fatty acid hydroxylase superfamily)